MHIFCSDPEEVGFTDDNATPEIPYQPVPATDMTPKQVRAPAVLFLTFERLHTVRYVCFCSEPKYFIP